MPVETMRLKSHLWVRPRREVKSKFQLFMWRHRAADDARLLDDSFGDRAVRRNEKPDGRSPCSLNLIEACGSRHRDSLAWSAESPKASVCSAR